jgi:hypothetical protein
MNVFYNIFHDVLLMNLICCYRCLCIFSIYNLDQNQMFYLIHIYISYIS